jgi:phage gp37-like protein
MTRPGIDTIDAALIAMLQASATLSYVPDNQIQEFDSRAYDFESAELIVTPPAILVSYEGGSYVPKNHDNSSYAIDERFTLIAVAENLRGSAEARQGGVGATEKGIYEMIEDLKSVIVTNRKLEIDSTTHKYVGLVLGNTVIFENVFYRSGQAAIGLQIQVTGTRWDIADA